MKKLIVLLLTVGCWCQLWGQQKFKYVDGHQLALKGTYYADSTNYDRIDSTNRVDLTPAVQKLAKNTSGLNINFETDAKVIRLKWTLDTLVNLWNMTPLAINGLDLYALNNGNWQFVASAKPTAEKNSVVLINNLNGDFRKYRLYLPLYAQLKKLEVGVPNNSVIKATENAYSNSQKIVIYGSSITQGASASRPGMAYPSIVSRKLNMETINLGFSGAGKMELEMAKVLAELPADVYVLDCVPNPSPQQIKERSFAFIEYLLKRKPKTPLIMVESIHRETANWDSKIKKMVKEQNMEFRKTFEKLKASDPKAKIFYIPNDKLTGDDHEISIDGTHLTDLGFLRFANALVPYLKKALLL